MAFTSARFANAPFNSTGHPVLPAFTRSLSAEKKFDFSILLYVIAKQEPHPTLSKGEGLKMLL